MAKLLELLQDRRPDHVFEVSEGGIAYVAPGQLQPAFIPLEPGVISPSPIVDNVLKADALADAVRPLNRVAGRKRGRAVLILPDYCARVAVLEFDSFPTDPAEQASLVRFRMKRSVPFDVDSAAVSYQLQNSKGKVAEVVVVAAALETIARYEAPFRAANLHPGLVTTSAMAMVDLERRPEVAVIARICSRILTVVVLQASSIKLVRTVELPDLRREEIEAVLLPTMAFVEDHLGGTPAHVVFCGIDPEGWEHQLGVPVEVLQSRLGTPNEFNAGLHGYLQSRTDLVGAAA